MWQHAQFNSGSQSPRLAFLKPIDFQGTGLTEQGYTGESEQEAMWLVALLEGRLVRIEPFSCQKVGEWGSVRSNCIGSLGKRLQASRKGRGAIMEAPNRSHSPWLVDGQRWQRWVQEGKVHPQSRICVVG